MTSAERKAIEERVESGRRNQQNHGTWVELCPDSPETARAADQAESDCAALLDALREAELEIKFCHGAIEQYKLTERDLCRRGIALRDDNARQRRAIYRLVATVHMSISARAPTNGERCWRLLTAERIRARLARLEGGRDGR